ncbi:hypothetical protein ES705_45567 [subsurface metagenome]
MGIIIRTAAGKPISPTKISPHILGLTGVRPVRDRKIENTENKPRLIIIIAFFPKILAKNPTSGKQIAATIKRIVNILLAKASSALIRVITIGMADERTILKRNHRDILAKR